MLSSPFSPTETPALLLTDIFSKGLRNKYMLFCVWFFFKKLSSFCLVLLVRRKRPASPFPLPGNGFKARSTVLPLQSFRDLPPDGNRQFVFFAPWQTTLLSRSVAPNQHHRLGWWWKRDTKNRSAFPYF